MDNFTPWGKNSPLWANHVVKNWPLMCSPWGGSKFAPLGKVKNGPLGKQLNEFVIKWDINQLSTYVCMKWVDDSYLHVNKGMTIDPEPFFTVEF
jgi:hypothetical protein